MRTWQTIIVRVFSLTNILQAAAGFFLISNGFFRVAARFESTGRQYALLPYYLMAMVNLAFLLGLVVGSVYLWRLRARGLHMCNLLFVCELAYWLLIWRLSSVPRSSGNGTTMIQLLCRGLDDAAVMGNAGLWPQIVTLYPIFGLILLNIAYHGLPSSAKR